MGKPVRVRFPPWAPVFAKAAAGKPIMLKQNKISVALVQMTGENNTNDNLNKAISRITEAALKGANIVCLQELFSSLYFCQTNDQKYFSLAESIPGPTSEKLAQCAKQNKVVLVASLFEKEKTNYYNTAIVIDQEGKLLGKYRKMHIPDDLKNHYSEMYYFKPGDLGYPVFETIYGKIGVLVCWDQWYPEAARMLAVKGAQIIFYPTSIGWPGEESKTFQGKIEFDAWVTIQRSHAIANTIFVGVANRCGKENQIDFWGGSFFCGPFGEILTQASHNKEETLIANCDLGLIQEIQNDWPFLDCRRSDSFKSLTQTKI